MTVSRGAADGSDHLPTRTRRGSLNDLAEIGSGRLRQAIIPSLAAAHAARHGHLTKRLHMEGPDKLCHIASTRPTGCQLPTSTGGWRLDSYLAAATCGAPPLTV